MPIRAAGIGTQVLPDRTPGEDRFTRRLEDDTAGSSNCSRKRDVRKGMKLGGPCGALLDADCAAYVGEGEELSSAHQTLQLGESGRISSDPALVRPVSVNAPSWH